MNNLIFLIVTAKSYQTVKVLLISVIILAFSVFSLIFGKEKVRTLINVGHL